MRTTALALVLAACAHDHPPATVSKAPANYRIVERGRRQFRLGTGCGNGPFRIVVDVPRFRWMGRLWVSAISERELPLRFKSDRGSLTSWLWDSGPDPRCHAKDGEEVAAAPVARDSGRSRGHGSPAAPEPAAVQDLAPATIAVKPPADRPRRKAAEAYFNTDGFRKVPDLDGTSCWYMTGLPEQPMKIEMWLPTVQKLDDVIVEVSFEDIQPLGSDQDFRRHVDERLEHDRGVAQSRAALCQKKPQDPQCWVGCSTGNDKTGFGDSFARTPDPPPPPRAEKRPSRPRADAEWIAGSWRWTGSKYQWDDGFWRLPEAAVTVASAPEAPAPIVPAPPPVPRVEPPPGAPSAAVSVVWVPGYWAWTGAGWGWIAGAWRVPPAPAARFAPPRVVGAPGGYRAVPGRWILFRR